MSPDTDDLSRAFLELVKGDDAHHAFALATAATTFGRVPGNTHVISDASVSRQHAKLFVRDGRHWIADLHSTHGTFVNGTKVSLQTLTDGDEVRLGTTLLRYRSGAPKPVAKPPSAVAPPPAAPLAAAPPRAPVPPEPPTGSFDLELPEAGAPPKRPAPSTGIPAAPRSGLTAAGEDPFAAAASARGADVPAIEMRGATARQHAARTTGAPVVAASSQSPTTHLPPPIAMPPRRRGAFSFLGDDLNQRGAFARGAAWIVALAAAVGLGWVALRAFDLLPKDAVIVDDGDDAPQGPPRPTLPERR
jgi:predicted component of type VI protein secretion system